MFYDMYDNKQLDLKLEEIANVLSENYTTQRQVGILTGTSGLSLFQFYYARFLNSDSQSDIALDVLTRSIEIVNKGGFYQTYCSGLAGLGWGLSHLKQEGFVELDSEILMDIDGYLHATMQSWLRPGNYDFLHGALGFGFYFLKRYKNAPSQKLKLHYKNYIIELLNFLNSISSICENGIRWQSVNDFKTGEKGYDLSLSHGISSIVNFLSRLYNYDDFKDKVKEMLRGGVDYILSFMKEQENSISLFPNYIIMRETVQWNSRVSWCYGDLGIGLSLWKSAKALNDEVLKNTAIQILMHTTLRTSQESTMVQDAGLCHGSFGNAQIFNYMYRQTKMIEFKNAAKFWINDGLSKAIHEDGYAGFKMWTKDGWKNKLSILEGIAGIGLAIISYLSEEDTNWDECLMIS